MGSNAKRKGDDKRQTAPGDADFPIVGVGASAGGIQALKEFFGHVSPDSGMAYVVILHMSPAHESKLAEILQVNSKISVTQVTGRVKVVPDHVYVIPPNQNLEMTDGHLALTHMIGVEERRSPVDLFFRTLAATNERRAVSVILSGSGADGSVGLKRVKEHGGVVFVQDPHEAEYADMPRNAIATGAVDYILPVSEIPAKIASFNKHRGSLEIPELPREVPGNDEEVLQEVFRQLRLRTGHDFSNYKRGTILRRLERRIGIRELSGLSDYLKYLKETPDEAQALVNDLLISVTNFFRDPESLEILSREVLTRIVQEIGENDQARVWIAGCATGEEAYTLAMLLSEVASSSSQILKTQLFATDLDADAIAVAREGYYTEAEVADVSAERLRRFFVKESDGYRVRRDLRETILFAVHNLIKDPPFSHLDLISCRNLLIYLNRTAQARVMETMHFALNPGGYLFLGASESLDAASELFSAVYKDQHIFRSKPVLLRTTLPVPEITLPRSKSLAFDRETTTHESQAAERLSSIDLHLRLLEQFAPSSVVINEEYEILHVSDRAGRYLQFSGGEPSRNLLKVVLPELRMELRATLYRAIQNRMNLESAGVQITTDDGTKAINLIVRPVLREHGPTRGFILVIFQESEVTTEIVADVVKTSESLAQRLESELVRSKAQLRATVEQYEIQQEELRASNEELQAMNEELRSAAEELETSKEELQSINEELTTVNQELKIKIEELSQANDDFANLINSTEIGTIFLDRSLKVKLFTPRAQDTFNLIVTDVGRSLLDITNKLDYDELSSDINYVSRTLRTVDREVRSMNGPRWYVMRILPYRTSDDHIDGIVVTVIDISETKVAQKELQQARDEMEDEISKRTGDLTTAKHSLEKEVSQQRSIDASRVKLLSQLINAQEEERKRLARDLHDQLGQQLTALRLNLERIQQGSNPDQIKSKLHELLKITSRLDADVDFLAWELRPAVLDDLGLIEALGNYVSQWGEHFDKIAKFHTSGFDTERLPREMENTLYRIAQEALNNVAKHSRATGVDVLFERRDNQVVLIIEDNGKGFDIADENSGSESLGIIGMRERVALVRGSLEIESAPNKGTTIFVRVPVETDRPADD